MLRNKPRLKYSGLTIVLSNQSRFDTINLLSANGGHLLNEHCLRPEYNVMQCDVRLAEDTTPLLEGTKCILCLGEFALHTLVPESRDNSLGEVRGSIYYWNSIPVVASFFPQDAVDMRNHEAANNPLSKDYTVDDENEDDENSTEDFDSVKRHGRTKRSNYAFWLRQDVARCKHILQFGIPISQEQPVYKTYPNSNEVIDVLMSHKNEYFYFDMETDYEEQNMQCFSFSFDGRTIYNTPILDWSYRTAYSRLSHILRALAFAIRDNTIVSHNGANFDFFVLGWKYRLPVYKCYDTMVAHHRCTPGYELVDTVCGRKQIKDLVGKENFYVWSWKNGKPFPAKVKRVFKTMTNAQLVRVHCWRKKFAGIEKFHIDCTPDHKFLVKGKWLEAQVLVPKTSLTRVSIVFSKSDNDYDTINKWDEGYIGERCASYKAHRYIYECLNGPIKIGHEIHHKDENKKNNEPSNLESKPAFFHRSEHRIGVVYNLGMPAWNKNTGHKATITKEKLEELHNSGMSQKNIGQIVGIDTSDVSRLFKKFEIKSRSLKEAQRLRRENEKNCKVISVEFLANKEDVYCMEVEDTNCYSCNGVIIHNCWPDVEKSLGHAVSHLTWERFHKDEDSQGYMSQAQMDKRLAYCGKDVYTMALVHKAIETHAKKIPGLQHSIDTANASIVPYLTASLQGIQYNERKFAEICKENDALMTQYLRIINILIGPKSLPEVKRSVQNKAKGFPGSNAQCCHYFHEMLGYPVVARSKKTGKPSLGKKALFKLALQHANPVIQFVLAYRTLAKEYGTLKFIPFRDSNNQIINLPEYDKILNPTNYQPSLPFASP